MMIWQVIHHSFHHTGPIYCVTVYRQGLKLSSVQTSSWEWFLTQQHWNVSSFFSQVNTASWTHHQAAVCPACVRMAASVWTGWRVVSCASVRPGSMRNPTVRSPPAASPDSPSSPSEAWGRGSTSPSPSCKLLPFPTYALLTLTARHSLSNYLPTGWNSIEMKGN